MAANRSGSAVLHVAVFACLATTLATNFRDWAGRSSGSIALALTAVSLAAAIAAGTDLVRLVAAAGHMGDAILLMLAVALIRPALARVELDQAVAALVAKAPAILRP